MERLIIAAVVGVASLAGLVWWLSSGSEKEESGRRNRRERRATRPGDASSQNTSHDDKHEEPNSKTEDVLEEAVHVKSQVSEIRTAEDQETPTTGTSRSSAGPVEDGAVGGHGRDEEKSHVKGFSPAPDAHTSPAQPTVQLESSPAEEEEVVNEEVQAENACATDSALPSISVESAAQPVAMSVSPDPDIPTDEPPMGMPEDGTVSSDCLPGVDHWEDLPHVSDFTPQTIQVFVASDLVGRFIGRNGHYIKQLQQTGASVALSNQGGYGRNVNRMCTISGGRAAVKQVMAQVAERFPSIAAFQIGMSRFDGNYRRLPCPNPGVVQWPSSQQLVDVNIVSIDSPHCFHVHLPKDGSVRQLNDLNAAMKAFYPQRLPAINIGMEDLRAAGDLTAGHFCAVQVRGDWLRGRITSTELPESKLEVLLMDFGSHVAVNRSDIRVLR